MTDRKVLKQEARQSLREAGYMPVLVTLVVTVILVVLYVLSGVLSGQFEAYREMIETFLQTGVLKQPDVGDARFTALLLVLAMELLSPVITVGYTIYTLRVSRGVKASVGDVFDAFGIFLRALVTSMLLSFIRMFWSFLSAMLISSAASFVTAPELVPLAEIPGYTEGAAVAAVLLSIPALLIPVFFMYPYRLSIFFMLDNRHLRSLQCLAASRFAMRRRRWELIRLDLSLLGWYVLSVIPIANLWARPYIAVTMAKYYDAVAPGFWEGVKRDMQARQSQPPQSPWQMRGQEPSEPERKPDDGDSPPPTEYHIPGEHRDDGEEK